MRWSRTDAGSVANPEAYLVTVVGRRATDFLRAAKRRRETYTGPWLPEPVANEPDPAWIPRPPPSSPTRCRWRCSSSSRRSPRWNARRSCCARCSTGPTPRSPRRWGAASRRCGSWCTGPAGASTTGTPASAPTSPPHAQVVNRFLAACQGADLEALLAVLAPDVVIISDSGGQAQAPRRPVYGRDKVARLLVGFAGRVPEGLTLRAGVLQRVARHRGARSAGAVRRDGGDGGRGHRAVAAADRQPGEVGVPARGRARSAVTTQMPARPVLPGWASASTWVPAAERIVTPAVVVSTAAASAQPRAAA